MENEQPKTKATYDFTPQERLFVERQMAQANAVQMSLNNILNLICVQQGISAQMELKPDGSGLIERG